MPVRDGSYPEANDRALVALRKWAYLLDAAFRVPGTGMRFGLDPIVGIVPGAGDFVTGVFAVVMLLHAVRLRVPKVVLARMLLNSGLDLLAGSVPLIGDLFDAGYKANLRNLSLLERHARPGLRPATSDYVVVGVFIGLLALIGVIPLLVLWWLLTHIPLV